MTKITFALRIPGVGPASSAARLIETTQEAEGLGYDAVIMTDHIHKSFEKHKMSPPGAGWYKDPTNTLDPNHFEAVASLSFLAGMARTIDVGVGVMALPLRDPVVLAKELATLDALTGGRVILGVGVSNVTDKEEYAALGVPFLPYAERYALVGEYVAAMRTIWEQPTASFHGRYVDFEGVTVYPKPVRRIPIWVGCGSLSKGLEHPAVKFTLEHADGWLFPFLATAPEVEVMIRDFKRSGDEAGRDLTDFAWFMQRRVSIGATMEEARENVAWMATEQGEMWRYAGYMQAQGAQGTQSSMDKSTTGTPVEVRAMIQDYIDAGATGIELVFSYATYDVLLRQIRLFGNEVLPAFK
jgi:probable F420-dependent oxidoreductase